MPCGCAKRRAAVKQATKKVVKSVSDLWQVRRDKIEDLKRSIEAMRKKHGHDGNS